jgi:hypothetical protein
MTMTLVQLMTQKQDLLHKKWFQHLTATYPADSAPFIQNRKDPFANPLGHNSAQALKGLLAWLIEGSPADRDRVAALLDPVIRIRAVQVSFTPSRAVGFVFALKGIVRETLGDAVFREPLLPELLRFEDRIEDLGLHAFDLFVSCRETIYEIKANETRRSVYRAFQRARLLVDIAEEPVETGQACPPV